MNLRCLIVDDEPIARSILEKYVSKTPYLQLAGTLDNALGVVPFLNQHEVDLIFLDINMPEFTGIDLLKSMHKAPEVIITTAYSEYGAESYDYAVTDYLLKPIPFERFMKAIHKVTEKSRGENTSGKILFLKEDQLTHKVALENISHVQAYGNYIRVFTREKTLVVRKTIAEMESVTRKHLIRVHKSYLIAPTCIKRIDGNEIRLDNGTKVPIGKVYRQNLDSTIKGVS